MKGAKYEAIQKLKEAYDILHEAGCGERLSDMAWNLQWSVDDERDCASGDKYSENYWGYEWFNCAVCDSDHHMELRIIRPEPKSFQYALEFIVEYYYHGWGFWSRFKKACGVFWDILWHKMDMTDFLVNHGDDLAKFKDLLLRFDRIDGLKKTIEEEENNERRREERKRESVKREIADQRPEFEGTDSRENNSK